MSTEYDYFHSLKPAQRKLIQTTKDIFDEANSKNLDDGYILGRLIKGPDVLKDKQIFHVIANTISKETNDLILSKFELNPPPLAMEEPDNESYVVKIANVHCNAFALNEKLKATKLIKDIVSPIPTIGKVTGLTFQIKLDKPSQIKTLAIRFTDGNIASYKFDVMFMDEKSKILSEIKGQRNSRVTSLLEFYELENIVMDVDRVIFTITDKYIEGNVDDNTVKLADFIMSNDVVSPDLKESKVISAVDVSNVASEYNYLNHPSLIKLRVSTNAASYPTLYEIKESVSGAKNDDKNLRIYNPVGQDNVISTTPDEDILFRIGNPNVAKFPDNVINNSLSTLKLKGCMKYGGYKNKFIAFRIIPMKFDSDYWSFDFVTRGGDMEDESPNAFRSIVQMSGQGFSFNRQLVDEKADVFEAEVHPAYSLKLRPDEEIGVILYQFNLNDTEDVQYYIYVKQANDIEWRLYNSFVDDKRLVGENYKDQTISWGGIYDYIFFREITKMKLLDISFGELVTPIRKIE